MRAFLTAHPEVRLITPWNEANHAAEPTAGRPDRAAAYYNAARRACAGCTLVAADVIDGPGMLSWLADYRRALDEAPAVWGLHDYYDTTYFHTTGLADYARAVTGQIWLTETGGIVGSARATARSAPADELRARASVSFAFETARAFAGRVARLYLYQWQADPDGRFDAGLLRADGTARPALDVLARRSPRCRAPGARRVPDIRDRSASSPRAVPARVTVRASGVADVRLRCSARARGRCAGRLWIEDAALASVTLVNGRLPGRVLRPVGRAFSVGAARTTHVRFKVPRAVLVHAWGRRLLRLRLMVASPDEPFALSGRYRADAWRAPARLSPRRRAR